ncbi:hypothetical protein [Pelagibacterium lentulum]|uniref:Uncharacterized protein n=1 Tax=Pelagibacterium lentulum TaxID=2029865 RepID=A0A916W4C7_9HYPH|nr:hypothetical protein [Pelagibacterium lentulum]GGA64912.1 hypothetical protein GCM10011499_39200 [Pelagibacterium lentulum]
MRIEITAKGIYGVNGEIPVGTELTVKEEPKGWGGRYRVISGGAGGKSAVTNPAGGDAPKTAVEVLAMATDGTHFQTFAAEARKLLGDKTPSSKDEIVKALEELATKPE